jgi:hypothetical protein
MKNIDNKLNQIKAAQEDVKLPVIPQQKQDQRRSAGPSLYNFYQRIIDRTQGIEHPPTEVPPSKNVSQKQHQKFNSEYN